MDKLQSVLTCSICLEVFQNPVTLSCQHTFCRTCLQMFADSYKPDTDDDRHALSVPDTDEQIISCPACRAVINLGNKGVVGLPKSYHLAEIVEKLQEDDETGSKALLCEMCEGESKAVATKACETCSIVYCDTCFAETHPQRGPLKRHNVMPVGEFVAEKPSQEAQEADDVFKELNPAMKCEEHESELTIYCVSCEQLICNDCLAQHNKHVFSDIPTISETMKVDFLLQIEGWKEQQTMRSTIDAELTALMSQIRKKEVLQCEAVEDAYNSALKALNAWRMQSLEEVKRRHEEMYSECQSEKGENQQKLEGIGDMIVEATELVGAGNVHFIKRQHSLITMYDKKFGDDELSEEEFCELIDDYKEVLDLHEDTVLKKRICLTETVGDPAQDEEVSSACDHDPVTCDYCDKTVVGVRYKCGNCANYDLCEGCERVIGIHDPNHVFLKLRRPRSGAGFVQGRFIPLLNTVLYETEAASS